MTCWSKIIVWGGLGLCGLSLSGNSNADNANVYSNHTIVEGSVIEVSLASLRPTQSVIAHDQVNYKLALYRENPQQLFSDLCKNAGWGRKVDFTSQSKAAMPNSYRCLNAGNKKRKLDNLKTVVVGPNNQLYLTDGHHTFSGFFDMADGGPDFQVAVYVQANLAQLSQDAFWQQMVNQGKAWLYNASGNKISYQAMPQTLGRTHLQNDAYRAALYFLRDGVWSKPKPAVEFVEFYWAQYLRKQPELAFPGYYNDAQYLQWLERIHAHLLQLKPSSSIFGDLNAAQLGWQGRADYAGLNGLLCKREPLSNTLGKLGIALTQRGMSVQCDKREFLDRTSLSTGLGALPPAVNADGSINVLIEIAAGTNAKWQQSKSSPLTLQWEYKQGQPRQVHYLAYPANYGIVTSTLLPKEKGGDGDPLDVLVLGPALPQGIIQRVRVVGVMRMLDNGEQDDKILAVPLQGLFSDVFDLPQLQANYPGAAKHIQLWFERYKGAESAIAVDSIDDAAAARAMVESSLLRRGALTPAISGVQKASLDQ